MKLRYHFSRQRRQLRHLGKQILRLRAAGQSIPKALVAKFRRLSGKLLPRIGTLGLQRTLGAAAILLGFGLSVQAQAPVFDAPVANPFGIGTAGFSNSYYNYPVLADLDGDGDLDLITTIYDYDDYSSVAYFENTGTAASPSFGAAVTNPFGIELVDMSAGPLALVDLDGDGDLDLMTTGFDYSGYLNEPTIQYLENIGSASTPAFAAPQSNPFGLTTPDTEENALFFEFGDLDGDGDLDIIGQSYDENANMDGSLEYYYENTSDNGIVSFADPVQNPFGLAFDFNVDSGVEQISDLADIDGDGDLDVLVGKINLDFTAYEYSNDIVFYENTGTPTAPAFGAAQTGAFGIETIEDIDEQFRFTTGDLDGDGDLDLLAFNSELGFLYYNNSVLSSVAETPAQLELNLAPNPTNGLVTLTTPERVQRIEVLNIIGRRIKSLAGTTAQIDLSDQPAGTYLIKVVTDDNRFSVRRIRKQ